MAIPFKELDDGQLAVLADKHPKRLLAYVHAARLNGQPEAAFRALSILIFSMKPFIRTRVALKVPDFEIEEMTSGAITHLTNAVVNAPPYAASVAQIRAWMASVISKFCAGDYRSPGAETRRRSYSYDVADSEGAQIWEWGIPDGAYEAVGFWEIVDGILAGLSEEHEMIVRLKVFGGVPSIDIVGIMWSEYGLRYTANRVDKVASRFRIRLQEELDEFQDS